MAEFSGKYEVVVPIVTEDGIKPVGEAIELTHEDAETFLRRGFVRESQPAPDDTPEDDTPEDLDEGLVEEDGKGESPDPKATRRGKSKG